MSDGRPHWWYLLDGICKVRWMSGKREQLTLERFLSRRASILLLNELFPSIPPFPYPLLLPTIGANGIWYTRTNFQDNRVPEHKLNDNFILFKRKFSYVRVRNGWDERSMSNQESFPSLLPTMTLSPERKKQSGIWDKQFYPWVTLNAHPFGKVERRKRQRGKPAGWIAMEETSRSPVASFLMSFCFKRSYTRTFFFVAMKKTERVGWKTEVTGRPCNLNGSLWVSFFESWCIKTALDSRKIMSRKITWGLEQKLVTTDVQQENIQIGSIIHGQ